MQKYAVSTSEEEEDTFVTRTIRSDSRSGLVFFKATGTRRCVLFCSDMSEQLNSAAQSLGIMYIKGIYNSASNVYIHTKKIPSKAAG